ncbi:MAG: DUF5343 domain-containing protein [Acidimicrobiales bacterium]
MGLPYVLNNGNLGKFLGEIVGAPVPAKVDNKYLETRGYTGANDKYLVAFLKNLGFIDKGGVPVERWHDHRHSGQSTAIRADGVREAFSGFFGVYPDAPKRTETEFNNWARVEDSKASPTTIKRSWATFRAMLPLSDFRRLAYAVQVSLQYAGESATAVADRASADRDRLATSSAWCSRRNHHQHRATASGDSRRKVLRSVLLIDAQALDR